MSGDVGRPHPAPQARATKSHAEATIGVSGPSNFLPFETLLAKSCAVVDAGATKGQWNRGLTSRTFHRVKSTSGWTRDRIERALERYVDQCFANHVAPRVDEFAAITHISRHTLIRIFRDVFGTTPKEELTRLQFARIEHLLIETPLSNAEIAASAGYRGYSSFWRRFERRYGMSPEEFRSKERASRS